MEEHWKEHVWFMQAQCGCQDLADVKLMGTGPIFIQEKLHMCKVHFIFSRLAQNWTFEADHRSFIGLD